MLIMYEADWSRAEEGVRRLRISKENRNDGDDLKSQRSPCVVKLIDFAHARLTPGEGPDMGVLQGIDTMLKLLDGRIMEVGGCERL